MPTLGEAVSFAITVSPHFSHVWTGWGTMSKISPNINILREIGYDSGKNSLFFNLPCLSWPATRKCLAKQAKLQRNFRSLVTAQVGRLNQVCGPAYTEKRRQIPSNSTTGLIREGLPGHARGVPGQLRSLMSMRNPG